MYHKFNSTNRVLISTLLGSLLLSGCNSGNSSTVDSSSAQTKSSLTSKLAVKDPFDNYRVSQISCRYRFSEQSYIVPGTTFNSEINTKYFATGKENESYGITFAIGALPDIYYNNIFNKCLQNAPTQNSVFIGLSTVSTPRGEEPYPLWNTAIIDQSGLNAFVQKNQVMLTTHLHNILQRQFNVRTAPKGIEQFNKDAHRQELSLEFDNKSSLTVFSDMQQHSVFNGQQPASYEIAVQMLQQAILNQHAQINNVAITEREAKLISAYLVRYGTQSGLLAVPFALLGYGGAFMGKLNQFDFGQGSKFYGINITRDQYNHNLILNFNNFSTLELRSASGPEITKRDSIIGYTLTIDTTLSDPNGILRIKLNPNGAVNQIIMLPGGNIEAEKLGYVAVSNALINNVLLDGSDTNDSFVMAN